MKPETSILIFFNILEILIFTVLYQYHFKYAIILLTVF